VAPSGAAVFRAAAAVLSASAFHFSTQAAALTAAIPKAPRLNQRLAGASAVSGASKRRYVSASGLDSAGRGFIRRSGAGIHRLM
jgi:hypothetical protein